MPTNKTPEPVKAWCLVSIGGALYRDGCEERRCDVINKPRHPKTTVHRVYIVPCDGEIGRKVAEMIAEGQR